MTITSNAICKSVDTQPLIKNQSSDRIAVTRVDATHHNHARMSMLPCPPLWRRELSATLIRNLQPLALSEQLLLLPRRLDRRYTLGQGRGIEQGQQRGQAV